MLNLTELKKYSMPEAIYIRVFEVSVEDLKAKSLKEIIADYEHLSNNVEEAIETLRVREEAILRRVLNDKLTLAEVGEELNITAERARQTLNKAFRKLTEPFRKDIIKGVLRQKRIEEKIRQEREAAVAEKWVKIGAEIERQKEQKMAQIATQLALDIRHLSLTPVCENKLNTLGVKTVGALLERFPYNPQTNGLVGLAVADGIEEADYREIWSALFMAGLLIRAPELPDFCALRKAEQIKNGILEIATMGIDELELSVRSYNCLKRAGVETAGELLDRIGLKASELPSVSHGELVERLCRINVRNMGRKCIEEIADHLLEVSNNDF